MFSNEFQKEKYIFKYSQNKTSKTCLYSINLQTVSLMRNLHNIICLLLCLSVLSAQSYPTKGA